MLLEGLKMALEPQVIILVFSGVTLAIITGALPGMGAGLTMALIIPLTYYLKPHVALILLGSIYCAAIYGGGISAILINTPGTSGSAASCLDGYAMSQQGKGGIALGISLMASVVAGIIGTILLMFFSPILAKFVLYFGPAEYFWLAICGLTIVAIAAKGSFLKGYISAGIGLFMAFVGFDSITGCSRYTFGSLFLLNGFSLIPVLLGLFAFSQVLIMIDKAEQTISQTGKIKGSLFEGFRIVFKYPKTLIRSSLIGVVVGAIPATGISVSNWLAYTTTMQVSKHPETFGKGDPEGVLAPEAANNATIGGSIIPTLTLGIPGSESTAVLLGGLLLHGLRPGTELFTKQGNIVFAFFWGLILANIIMLLLGTVGLKYFARVTIIPNKIIIPLIVVITATGAFAINNSINDIMVVFSVGAFAYVMRKLGYSPVCTLLAFILGPIAEKNYFRTLAAANGSYMKGFFDGYISWLLIILTILSLGFAIYNEFFKDEVNNKKVNSTA